MEKYSVKDVSDEEHDSTVQKGHMEKSPVNHLYVQDNSLKKRCLCIEVS